MLLSDRPWQVHREQADERTEPATRRGRHTQQAEVPEFLRSQPGVPMVEPADHADLDDAPLVRRFNRSRLRRVFSQRKVRPEAVVVRDVTPNKPTQMVLVQHYDVIEAVSA